MIQMFLRRSDLRISIEKEESITLADKLELHTRNFPRGI